MFSKNKKINYGVKKIDMIVTGLIIGSALASIFGLTHTKKLKEIFCDMKVKFFSIVNKASNRTIGIIGKTLVFITGIFFKK